MVLLLLGVLESGSGSLEETISVIVALRHSGCKAHGLILKSGPNAKSARMFVVQGRRSIDRNVNTEEIRVSNKRERMKERKKGGETPLGRKKRFLSVKCEVWSKRNEADHTRWNYDDWVESGLRHPRVRDRETGEGCGRREEKGDSTISESTVAHQVAIPSLFALPPAPTDRRGTVACLPDTARDHCRTARNNCQAPKKFKWTGRG